MSKTAQPLPPELVFSRRFPHGITVALAESGERLPYGQMEKEIMKTATLIKAFALIVVGIILTASLFIGSVGARTVDDDAAALYKAKCAACHGASAEKRFDATKPDAELVETILKGKKAEKPPNMPSYGDKGITEDQAKALESYMKTLKK